MATTERDAVAEAWEAAAEHLEKLADLADGRNAAVIAAALLPVAYAFRVRAERERTKEAQHA